MAALPGDLALQLADLVITSPTLLKGSEKVKPFRTLYLPGLVDEKQATEMYHFLKHSVAWEAGIPSKKLGFTRKAKPLTIGGTDVAEREVTALVLDCLDKAMPQLTNNYELLGAYLNNYESGEMFTPSHSHPKQHQMIISLGETRTLIVGAKSYPLKNGDVIFFGSSSHAIPKEVIANPSQNFRGGRISIATFMTPLVRPQ